jgi:hypothetical protein
MRLTNPSNLDNVCLDKGRGRLNKTLQLRGHNRCRIRAISITCNLRQNAINLEERRAGRGVTQRHPVSIPHTCSSGEMCLCEGCDSPDDAKAGFVQQQQQHQLRCLQGICILSGCARRELWVLGVFGVYSNLLKIPIGHIAF